MSRHHGIVTLGAAVLRGLRARASLTAGCLVLAMVAIASAVLGPAYQASASQSFLVARLSEADPVYSGVSVTWRPSSDAAGDQQAAQAQATAVGQAQLDGLFGPAHTSLVAAAGPIQRVFGLPGGWSGAATLRAKPDHCAALTITAGSCPTRPGQVMMLASDADSIHLKLGDHIHVLGYPGPVTVSGLYAVPDHVADTWFDASRFVSQAPTSTEGGIVFQPAPLVADPSMFDALPAGSWSVAIDRFLVVTPDISPEQVRDARRAVVDLPAGLSSLDDGSYRVSGDNGLQYVIAEIDRNRDTARKTVTPAVVSLVLVALALLVRLLGAAADQRRNELALASLRGMSSRQMWTFGLAEPLTLLVIAAPLGVLLGYLAAVAAARTWLVDGVRVTIGGASVVAAALVLLAAVAAVVGTVWRALGEPLSSQLAGVRRPVRSGRGGMVARTVLIVAAVVVVVASLTARARSAPRTSDLVLPLLLAGAAGVAITAVAVAGARWWAKRTARRRGITGFVAARAISRRREGSLVILPLTAALAISVFAGGVYAAASTWRSSNAATEVGAALSYRSPLPLAETVALTHRIDPDGKWLMAAGAVNQADFGERLALDTPRLARVGAWPGTWTPGLSASDVAHELGPRNAGVRFAGTTFTMTLDNQVRSSSPTLGLALDVVSSDGSRRTLFLGPFGPGVSTSKVKAAYCAQGCQVSELLVGGPAATTTTLDGTATLTGFTADGQDVPSMVDASRWRPVVSALHVSPDTTSIQAGHPGLAVQLDSGSQSALGGITPNDVPEYRPVLMGRTQATRVVGGSGDHLVVKTDSLEGLPVQPVGVTESMPFFGPRGFVIDYTMLTRDQQIPDSVTDVYVLARSDTPAAVTAALKAQGLHDPTRLSTAKQLLDQDAYALSLNLYLVAALAAVALALAGLAVNLAVQMPERRRDAASLRVVGVRRRQIVSAVFVEICAVLGVAGLAGILAGSLAQFIVVRTVTLGFADTIRTPRVVPTLDVSRLGVLVALVTAVLVVVATVVASLAVRRARASTLRESVR